MTGDPWGDLAEMVATLEYVLADLDRLAPKLAGEVEAAADPTEEVQALVGLAGSCQDLRRRLSTLEAYTARVLGQALQAHRELREGLAPDGRPYEVVRARERREWDHDGWKADVRARLLETSDLHDTAVDVATGEEFNLYDLLARVQEVHGAGAPKLTPLRALGLTPDDYCHTSLGPYQVRLTGEARKEQQ